MVASLSTQMRARLERRDTLLERQLLLNFRQLPVAAQEMLLWAALDCDGEAWLTSLAATGSIAAHEQLTRLRLLLSGQPI